MKTSSVTISSQCSFSSSCQTVQVSMYSEITMFCICTHICIVNIFISQVSCLMPFASLLQEAILLSCHSYFIIHYMLLFHSLLHICSDVKLEAIFCFSKPSQLVLIFLVQFLTHPYRSTSLNYG